MRMIGDLRAFVRAAVGGVYESDSDWYVFGYEERGECVFIAVGETGTFAMDFIVAVPATEEGREPLVIDTVSDATEWLSDDAIWVSGDPYQPKVGAV